VLEFPLLLSHRYDFLTIFLADWAWDCKVFVIVSAAVTVLKLLVADHEFIQSICGWKDLEYICNPKYHAPELVLTPIQFCSSL